MPSKGEVSPDSPTAHRVAAYVAANPGSEVQDIARALGWTSRHCSKALTGAKRGGMIDVSRNQHRARWYSAQLIGYVRAQEQIERRERQSELDRTRKERHKLKLIEIEADESGSDLADEPIRLIVPANVPLPFKCVAANSVFTWGQAA